METDMFNHPETMRAVHQARSQDLDRRSTTARIHRRNPVGISIRRIPPKSRSATMPLRAAAVRSP